MFLRGVPRLSFVVPTAYSGIAKLPSKPSKEPPEDEIPYDKAQFLSECSAFVGGAEAKDLLTRKSSNARKWRKA
jgi:hypothetical protein